ncbi:gamma-glutamyltransferase [Rodentibacter caecimuris]|uniref:Glutathione hydrolase proenzyme n=1 Tax=Rodentibacter caecimuris TaxID=1796644 RepID=A0AAJ3K515_9PAST|nr:gamma-glutamyltransferase [Rodentibacter heylii]AOF53121.1 Gamma-glutamyltranspeptidase [Pasteurellaceae bacterium NI1060]MCQ9123854.1 gamma-glutamyltransferase [Rodentibacter heylii]OOF72764.1 gamma-glutamyltransferase [Rodentibacter heylii]OOF73057.1 gamma-glutamyltransferase [Rodentibacter heylii]OOF74010.1 gamma-glutamyltransferase [Rodentibacter heylii]
MQIPFRKILLAGLFTSVVSLSQVSWASNSALTTNTAAARYDSSTDIFQPVYAKNGMVASEQAIATQVGVEILKQGGNAVDAAVAVGFTLAVVLPNAGNIGGGGFMVLHNEKTGEDFALDFRETAPLKASRDMYLDANGQVEDGKSLFTHFAVGVPGTVAGMELALQKWGTMPLHKVLEPAIKLAEEGFPISQTLANLLDTEKEVLGKWQSSRKIFFKNDRTLAAGEPLIQKDLANSLKLIAKEGAKAFYEGEIAEKIVQEMKQHNGLISLEDMRNYQAIERRPIVGNYRGYKIVTMPPPSSGGIHLVQLFNMLENYPLNEFGANSAKTIHYLAESMKLAYADRSEYLGDPDFVKIPVSGLTSKNYANSLIQSIRENYARPATEIKPGKPQPYESDQTTHYSVMDNAGNAVAVTYTLNLNFGSGIVAEGTGILLNNEMDDFSAKPGVANAFGLIGGDANAIEAKKRPLSSMTPTIVLKDNKSWLVTGSPGGARIITTVLQSISNTIDHNMNPAEAIVAPRIHHQWLPDELRIEEGISPDTLALLTAKGHKIKLKAPMGRVQIIQAHDGGFYGYSDPRNPDGKTLGF